MLPLRRHIGGGLHIAEIAALPPAFLFSQEIGSEEPIS